LNQLTGTHTRNGGADLIDRNPDGSKQQIAGKDDDDADVEPREILLKLEAAIGCEQYVE
jgi:hypothetical protein